MTGDQAAKARWCNDRNTGFLFGDDDLTAVGGWGLTPDGECCLTTWMSPFFVPDEVELASGLVGNLLSYHEGTVLTALRTSPAGDRDAADAGGPGAWAGVGADHFRPGP